MAPILYHLLVLCLPPGFAALMLSPLSCFTESSLLHVLALTTSCSHCILAFLRYCALRTPWLHWHQLFFCFYAPLGRLLREIFIEKHPFGKICHIFNPSGINFSFKESSGSKYIPGQIQIISEGYLSKNIVQKPWSTGMAESVHKRSERQTNLFFFFSVCMH